MNTWVINNGSFHACLRLTGLDRITLPKLKKLLRLAAAMPDWPDTKKGILLSLSEQITGEEDFGKKARLNRLRKIEAVIKEFD